MNTTICISGNQILNLKRLQLTANLLVTDLGRYGNNPV